MCNLLQISEDDELLEVGRKAVEDTLVEWRDDRLSVLGRGNGLVIREKDGSNSHIIRFGVEHAMRIALEAMHKHLLNSPEKGGNKDEGTVCTNYQK
jgi:hypothetical protein